MQPPPPAAADVLGHRFNDAGLLRLALTHPSFSADHNQRLEFLGDAVLGCVIAEALYRRFPRLPEGDLSRIRAHLVRKETLHEIAQSVELAARIRVGDGVLRTGASGTASILANALEALIGAVFLDGGFERARAVVLELFASRLGAQDLDDRSRDFKTRLQELLQGRRMALPRYAVVDRAGADHSQQFTVECVLPDNGIRELGEGPSRRVAEQQAAERAYRRMAGG